MLPTMSIKLGFLMTFCATSLTYLFASMISVSNSIPNIVHYTQILRDPAAELKFEFKHFVSVYGVSIYLKPDKIYIHTDAPDETIAGARDLPANIWTQLILNIPNVSVNKVHAPKRTAIRGSSITLVEHRSDFVRMDVVYRYGGLYLDWDVHVLRDLKPLRESGFANIVGREKGGGINNGCWMSQRGTLMMEIWSKAAQTAFDGRWSTHSVQLLTKVAESLVRKPKEVLILDEKAFSPSSWKGGDVKNLFQVHPETPESMLPDASSETIVLKGALGEWDDPTEYEAWQADYSSTYLLHAFRPREGGQLSNYTAITPEYVLARQSNYARAVFPAVQHALDAGLFSADDSGLLSSTA